MMPHLMGCANARSFLVGYLAGLAGAVLPSFAAGIVLLTSGVGDAGSYVSEQLVESGTMLGVASAILITLIEYSEKMSPVLVGISVLVGLLLMLGGAGRSIAEVEGNDAIGIPLWCGIVIINMSSLILGAINSSSPSS